MNLEPDAFSQFEHEGWQRVAGQYEHAWSGLSRPFIPHLLEALELTSGNKLLDVACGPGYVAEAALALGVEPIGVDFSGEMIRLARERSPEIEFREGDAQALDFEDKRFDVVVMNFGMPHLSNPEVAFAEAFRVLKCGSRYGFTVWAGPKESPGAKIIEEALEAHADMNVELPEGPDYFAYGDREQCRKTLGGLGFDPGSLGFKTVSIDWQVPTASFVFECERDAGVRTAGVLAAQTPGRLAAIQAQIEGSVRAYAREEGFAIPYAAHVVVVTKP